MNFSLARSFEVLERTPRTLRALLLDVSDFWARSNYGENTFSPFDVVGHLIEADTHNWMVRVNHILELGEISPFPPFDRYAMLQRNKTRSMTELLDEFEILRSGNLTDLHNLDLSPAQLALRGTHPDLGTVTLAQLLATWTVHDLGHTHQIVKAMAYQYRADVGPWTKMLTILPRP